MVSTPTHSPWASFAGRSAPSFTTSSSPRAFVEPVSLLLGQSLTEDVGGIALTLGFSVLACNVVNVLWIVFSIFIVSFRCIPFSKNWNITEPGTCLAQVPIVTAVAAWGLAIELTIWALPIPATWRLQMPRSNKVALTLIFGLGIFDIGVGVGRLVTVLQVDEDFTWSQVPALQWLAIEPSIAIIVACLCVCRPLMEKLRPKGWRQPFASGRLTEDHIKLVGSKNGTVHSTAGVSVGSGPGSMTASQTGPDELPKGAVHVRRDITVSADNGV
jgi:hypothetical protein